MSERLQPARYVLCVDPATKTGLALLRWGKSGPPECLRWQVMTVSKNRRTWLSECRWAAHEVCQGYVEPRDVLWLIEGWSRHSGWSAAVKLAQVQQSWIAAAESFRASAEIMLVARWQVPTGINREGVRASRTKGAKKGDGRKARKAAAQRYAVATVKGLKETPPEDVADAICMGSVWITNARARQSKLPF